MNAPHTNETTHTTTPPTGRTALRVGGLALLALSVGCAAFGPKINAAGIRKARGDRDLAYLDRACQSRPVSKEACASAAVIRAEETKDCSLVVKTVNDTPREDPMNQAFPWKYDLGPRLGKRLADCGEFTRIFEDLATSGGDRVNASDGATILLETEKAGAPLETEWLKYVAAHPGESLLPVALDGAAMKHIAMWLIEAGHTQHCAPMAAAIAGAKIAPRANGLEYYLRPAKCAEGAPIAADLLTNESEWVRTVACNALGDLGDASALEKVKIVAETDAAFHVEERTGESGNVYGVKVYPVRDACQGALGKLQLRKAH